MPHTTLETLPLDVCDRILTFLPDFLSLTCTVLSSKQLYDAYSPRKRSIMRAVELNEVGPALSFAVALVRTRNILGEEPLQVILEGLNDHDPDSSYWTINVTAAEARVLAGVSSVVRRLESFFCIYYKDRAAPVRTLSEIESLRFHRAIYWTWIISVLSNDTHKLSKPSGLDISFLKNMSDEEHLEIHEALQFLDVMYRSLQFRHSRFQGFSPNAVRPIQLRLDVFLAHFDGNINVLNAETLGNPLSRPGSSIVNGLVMIRTQRRIAKLFQEKCNSQSILTDSRVEDVQACQKCDTHTHELVGENNWHLLHPTLDMACLINALPGRLCDNAYAKIYLSALLERRHSFASMISEMFDSQNDPESGWCKTDWLCMNCIKDFLRERLFSWFVAELTKDGHRFNEDCWYGWNCRTQTHNLNHAKKLNHLCEPTDRDDTVGAGTGTNVDTPGITADMNVEE